MSYEGYALVERAQPIVQKSPLMLWPAEENTNFLLARGGTHQYVILQKCFSHPSLVIYFFFQPHP